MLRKLHASVPQAFFKSVEPFCSEVRWSAIKFQNSAIYMGKI